MGMGSANATTCKCKILELNSDYNRYVIDCSEPLDFSAEVCPMALAAVQ